MLQVNIFFLAWNPGWFLLEDEYNTCYNSFINFNFFLFQYSSRKSCVLLDGDKVKTLKYDILAYISKNNTASRRNIAYLYAIQHGARHIFDAYPETYVSALVDVKTFKNEIQHQLQSFALNVALGLVNERPYVKRVQNPYAHFGRSDLWTEGFRRNNQRHVDNHIYRICEVRPPSIEKVNNKCLLFWNKNLVVCQPDY